MTSIEGDAERSDAEPDARVRAELADQAMADAGVCVARAPQSAACLYGQAIALGLDARAHPTHAADRLRAMLEALTRVESLDPGYDHAGPARVRALVLIRAPGWPLGPGDVDAGLQAARSAVAREPAYPPNLLALAEALAKSGDAHGALDSYRRALDAAQSQPDSPERAKWMREAAAGLHRQ